MRRLWFLFVYAFSLVFLWVNSLKFCRLLVLYLSFAFLFDASKFFCDLVNLCLYFARAIAQLYSLLKFVLERCFDRFMVSFDILGFCPEQACSDFTLICSMLKLFHLFFPEGGQVIEIWFEDQDKFTFTKLLGISSFQGWDRRSFNWLTYAFLVISKFTNLLKS